MIACIVTVFFVVGGMLLLGLPGAILFELGTPILRLLFGADALERLPADSYWPIAIIMTLLWPVSIVVGYLIAFRLLKDVPRLGQIASFAIVLIGWDVVLTIACYLLGRRAA